MFFRDVLSIFLPTSDPNLLCLKKCRYVDCLLFHHFFFIDCETWVGRKKTLFHDESNFHEIELFYPVLVLSIQLIMQVWLESRTTDTQWRHISKKSENLGQCGRQNMLRPYLKIWDWDWIFGRAVKAISSLGVRSP